MTTLLTVKAAVLDLIRAYPTSTFDAENSSRDDWQVLDSPRGYAVVVTTAAESREADMIDGYGIDGAYQERHQIAVNVCQAIGTGETGLPAIVTALETLSEALKDYLRPYVRLNKADGVLRMQITRTGQPGQVGFRPQWYMVPITLQVDCESTIPDGSEAAQR